MVDYEESSTVWKVLSS